MVKVKLSETAKRVMFIDELLIHVDLSLLFFVVTF